MATASRHGRLGVWAAAAAAVALAATAAGETANVRAIASGLKEPTGVALHPGTGDIYVTESGTGRVLRIPAGGGSPTPVLADEWVVSRDIPRWAVTEQVSQTMWEEPVLDRPGAIAVASNGTIYVAEQKANGRILSFPPDENGQYTVAWGEPVPWLEQEFQWRALQIDSGGRLYVAGTDEIGNEFMKFGSALMREPEGEWWVLDHGPFAQFNTFAISDKEDFMLLGDQRHGSLSWWGLNTHIMLGGSPSTTDRDHELKALAMYPDGHALLGIQSRTGRGAALRKMDLHTQQQTDVATGFQSIGGIAMDRKNGRYIVTDPAAGTVNVVEFTPPMEFNEAVLRQIVRSGAGAAGLGSAAEAPAFLNTFIERLQTAAADLTDDASTHAIDFNVSDLAGKIPIVAGRVQSVIEVTDVEEDPIETIEFFLLFPSRVVITDNSVSPSVSFVSIKRKSGKLETTRPVFEGMVSAHRVSGTKISRIGTAEGGIQIPIVTCGLDEEGNTIRVHLSFMGCGVYPDCFLDLFQAPNEQSARISVPSPATPTGLFTYEASFMEEMDIEGLGGTKHKEEISNLLVAGFKGGGAGNRSVGWLRIGHFPASMMIGYGDTTATVTGAQESIRELMDQKRIEIGMEASETDSEGEAP